MLYHQPTGRLFTIAVTALLNPFWGVPNLCIQLWTDTGWDGFCTVFLCALRAVVVIKVTGGSGKVIYAVDCYGTKEGRFGIRRRRRK